MKYSFLFITLCILSGFQCYAQENMDQAPQARPIPEGIDEVPTVYIIIEDKQLRINLDGFPESDLPNEPLNPLTGDRFEEVLVGPTFRSYNPFNGYDYWRYVTVYNTSEQKERIHELAVFIEDCQDEGGFFGSYNYTTTSQAQVSSSLKLGDLGLSASFTESVSYSMSRNLRGTSNTRAEHTPFMIKVDWEGKTFIQTYNRTTGEVGYLRSKWFTQYPYNFSVQDAERKFAVERNILEECEVPEEDESTASPPAFLGT